MRNLFLIDGASGTGKTDLINYISNFKTSTSYVKKYTTREERQYEKESNEKLDLIHIDEEEFNRKNFEYVYTYGGKKYGFTNKQIVDAFKNSDNVFIIVRDVTTIRQLKESYSYLNVVSFFIYTDKNLITYRLKKDKHTPAEIKFRKDRLGIAYKSYLKNPDLYDDVLVNSGSREDYEKIIDKIYEKHQNKQNINPNLIFVLMSFNPSYDNIYDEFKDAAKLVDSSLEVKRIDKQRGDYSITNEILNNIAKARLIICDLTDERPNVYYELGYARGLKKPIITCAEKNTPLHFDIKDFHTIIYNNTGELRREISSEIKEHLKLQKY
jgi:guanylate kinase